MIKQGNIIFIGNMIINLKQVEYMIEQEKAMKRAYFKEEWRKLNIISKNNIFKKLSK